MRRNLTLLPLLAVCLMLLPIVAFGAGGDGLVGSAHDFVRQDHASEFGVPTGFTRPSKGGSDPETRAYTPGDPGAVGLCAFCHTPHRAIMTSLLWNHTLSTATFTWADADRTVGGTMLPTNIASWKGSSKLCLSCHDGSVALGDLAWYQGAEKRWSAAVGPPTQRVSGGSDGSVGDTHEWPDKYNVGATDGTLGAMKGNHPVGIPYPFGQVANTYNGITTGGGVVKGEFDADPTTKGIRLYKASGLSVVTAIGSGYGGTDVGMECGSCHDPHNGPTVVADTVSGDDRLVRGTVYGDGETFGLQYLCTKCHTGKN